MQKKLISNNYTPDFQNIIKIEELKKFILSEFLNTNTANKLNISYFVKNNYIKELNTIMLYMNIIGEEKITVKLLHNFIFGIGICSKCGIETTFRGFGNKYAKTCSNNNCTKTQHFTSNIDYDYVINNFIENNKFRIDKMKNGLVLAIPNSGVKTYEYIFKK